jgi:hypothetical protein
VKISRANGLLIVPNALRIHRQGEAVLQLVIAFDALLVNFRLRQDFVNASRLQLAMQINCLILQMQRKKKRCLTLEGGSEYDCDMIHPWYRTFYTISAIFLDL